MNESMNSFRSIYSNGYFKKLIIALLALFLSGIAYAGTGDKVTATIINVTPPGNSNYITSNSLIFTVTFTEVVQVNATLNGPRLALTIGSSTVYASYNSGSGKSVLVFSYMVRSEDVAGNGIIVNPNIDLNGATIKDAASNDANVCFSGFSLSGVFVNVIPPTVTTQAVSCIGVTSATGNGNITDLGLQNSSQYGVVWSTSANPTTALSTKTTQGTKSSTGAFTSCITGLLANTLYYVKAYVTNSAGTSYGAEVTFTTLTNGTFTGSTNSDWNTATNWAGGSVPTSYTDVTIPSGKSPVISATTNADCHNLTVASGATLTIASNASGTGSLIISGTSTGTVSCQNYITGGKWHLVSPAATGGDIISFILAGSNAIKSKLISSTNNYSMMDYDEPSNLWKSYFTSATLAVFNSGQGYSTQRTVDGIVTFTGTLTSGTKTVALTKTGAGWNCIGNPYTSAIKMNNSADASNNFLKTNAIDASKLDPNYACMYLWDDASTSYKILGNSNYGIRDLGQNIFQSGQGFFVKAKDNTGLTVQFTAGMQIHQPTTPFKSGQTSWPGFELTATTALLTRTSTVIAFNDAMTKGLDPTYDAGLLRGSAGISIYTHLLEDNGIDFAIQCLPKSGYQNFIIPVGLDYTAGGDVILSVQTTGLPLGMNLILEDRVLKTYTALNPGKEVKITVDPNTKGIGRFYLHTTALSANDLKTITLTSKLNAYVSANNEIRIIGEVSSKAIATLYDTQGKAILSQNLRESNLNVIPTSNIKSGIYLLSIRDTGKFQSFKLFIKQ